MNDLGEFVPGLPPFASTTPTPLAAVVTVRAGILVEYELVLSAGATAADVTTAMISIPPSAALVRQQECRDLSLVFRDKSADASEPDSVGLRS